MLCFCGFERLLQDALLEAFLGTVVRVDALLEGVEGTVDLLLEVHSCSLKGACSMLLLFRDGVQLELEALSFLVGSPLNTISCESADAPGWKVIDIAGKEMARSGCAMRCARLVQSALRYHYHHHHQDD